MAGGFIHRVISYVVNEIVVNGLTNSPAFQRFAVRTSQQAQKLQEIAQQKKKEMAEQLKDLSKNMDIRSRISNTWSPELKSNAASVVVYSYSILGFVVSKTPSVRNVYDQS